MCRRWESSPRLPVYVTERFNQDDTIVVSLCKNGFGHFFLSSVISLLSPSLWEAVRYRLEYCLRGPLSPKQSANKLLKCVENNISNARDKLTDFAGSADPDNSDVHLSAYSL